MVTSYYIPDYEEWVKQRCPESTPYSDHVYTAANEKKPNDRFYQLDRDHIDKTLRDIGNAILTIVEQAREEDKQLVELRKLAIEIQKVVQSNTRDVAFVGAQAAGKSLCINALHHRPNLAQTSASGKACTSAAIRYCLKPDAAHLSELVDAIIKFMGDLELREITAEHIRRYAYVHFPIVEGDGPSEEDTLAAQAALEFLQEVYNSRRDRESEAQLSALLNRHSIQNGDLLEATVEKAYERIRESLAGEDGTIFFNNVKPADLMKAVREYIEGSEDSPSLWPIVQHIEVQLWSFLTYHGVNSIDLPGLDDTNLIRMAAVHAIRRRAAFEMIVGRSDRVLTDANLHALIRQSIKAHGAKHTGLLIAQMDLFLLDDAAIANELETQTVEPFPIVKQYLEGNEEVMEAMRTAGADEEELKARAKYAEYITTQAKLAFINQRARAQEEEMRYKFAALDPNPIYVRAVSAVSYMGWLKKGYRQRPVISPKMSGIPEVRNFLLNLCASANWDAYVAHMDKVDMLISKCCRIMEATKTDNAFAIILPPFAEHVTVLQNQLQTAFNFLVDRVARIWTDAFEKDECQTELIEVVKGWGKGVRWNTYNKALRERGTTCKTVSAKYRQEGERAGFFSWNEEVSEAMAEHVEEFEQRMSTAVSALALDLDETITKACADILKFISASALPPRLKHVAVQEWNKHKVRIFAQSKRGDDVLQEAVRLAHQYATIETDVHCMVAQINMNDYETIEREPHPTGTLTRYEVQKDKMVKAMKGKTYRSRSLADRISDAVIKKAKEELRIAFDPFLQDLIEEVELFEGIIQDRIPPDYELTEKDRALRHQILKAIPGMREMRAELGAHFHAQGVKRGYSAESQRESEGCLEAGELRQEVEVQWEVEEMMEQVDDAERPVKRIKFETQAAKAIGNDLYWDFSSLDSDSNFADWQ